MLHPIGEVRIEAYNLLERFLMTFQKLPSVAECHNVNGFLADIQGIEDIISESVRLLLQGDTLAALVRTSPNLVRPTFRLFCRYVSHVATIVL